MDILQDALNLMIAPDPANLQSIKFTINGTFTPSSPIDGWNSVEVDVKASDTSIGYIELYGLREEEQHIGTSEILEIAETGTCGDNATYILYTNGLLEINGSGNINNTLKSRRDISNIIINNGITNIDDYAFQYCDRVTTIAIPDSVISIGICVF